MKSLSVVVNHVRFHVFSAAVSEVFFCFHIEQKSKTFANDDGARTGKVSVIKQEAWNVSR